MNNAEHIDNEIFDDESYLLIYCTVCGGELNVYGVCEDCGELNYDCD